MDTELDCCWLDEELEKKNEEKKKFYFQNSSAGNQIILHEEETDIIEIDETSLADKRTDLRVSY